MGKTVGRRVQKYMASDRNEVLVIMKNNPHHGAEEKGKVQRGKTSPSNTQQVSSKRN